MTKEEAINILQNIDPQCQKDCPVSRDVCAKQENRCLVSDALEYAVDFLSANVVEVKHGHWIENDNDTYSCSLCHACIPREQYYYDARKCIHCGADMRGEME